MFTFGEERRVRNEGLRETAGVRRASVERIGVLLARVACALRWQGYSGASTRPGSTSHGAYNVIFALYEKYCTQIDRRILIYIPRVARETW